MYWLYLIPEIAKAVAASALTAVDGYTPWTPFVAVAAGYGAAFFLPLLSLRDASGKCEPGARANSAAVCPSTPGIAALRPIL